MNVQFSQKLQDGRAVSLSPTGTSNDSHLSIRSPLVHSQRLGAPRQRSLAEAHETLPIDGKVRVPERRSDVRVVGRKTGGAACAPQPHAPRCDRDDSRSKHPAEHEASE